MASILFTITLLLTYVFDAQSFGLVNQKFSLSSQLRGLLQQTPLEGVSQLEAVS